MSDLQAIKKKLRNAERIKKIFEAIGCEYIKEEQRGLLITAQLPERFYSNNKRSVQARLNESLTCHIRNRSDFKGDIFNLISYIHHDKRGNLQEDLHNAKQFICELFGWSEFLKKGKGVIVKEDFVAPLKEIINSKKRKKEIKPNPVLPENTMNEFYYFGKPLPYKGWIEEGISYKTQMKYGVGFDLESKRVVFPIRNRFGKLVGVKGRTIDNDVDPKYIYLYKCNISQEWFNWHFAHPYILMEKKVIIVESEKSCMKFDSVGVYNTLAICSSDISEFQANMIKQLGLDIEIYLAYDKDKTPKEVKEHAKIFKGRRVYGIIDTEGLLGEKDSPIDCGYDVWEQLYKNNSFKIF